MSDPDPTSTALHCDGCGYDLRAHPADGKCPECGTSVAESRRLAAIPRRPAWRDSDPRWRRRMLAGAWVLVLVPLMAVLLASGWVSNVTVPNPFGFRGDLTLPETDAVRTYAYLTFCIGVVLLFSRERDRRPGPLDWTRRWGVTASYGVFLLGIARLGFITALVVIGIAALLLSIPLRNQPAVTGLLVELGAGYIYYGPHPSLLLALSLPVFSSAVILLACAPLYNALRSSGPRVPAMLLLAPLVLASLAQLTDVIRYGLTYASLTAHDLYYPFYFNPDLLASPDLTFRFIAEAAKWSACLAIAVWLSIAQIMAWRRRPPRAGRVSPPDPPAV